MSNSTPSNQARRISLACISIAGMLVASVSAPVSAALTNLADAPMASGSSIQAKPNIFFILDDSGSMDRTYMPDDVDTNEVGYRSHRCNTIYYNPDVTYIVPQDATGANLHNASPASYTGACSNGYDGSSCNTNLGTSYYWLYLGSATTLAWPTSGSNDCTLGSSDFGSGSVVDDYSGVCSNGGGLSATTYANPTNANCVTEHGSGRTLVWKRVTVTSAAADAQNYANWYSYYRTRLMMMKAASGRAFQDISPDYRVGFMTISPGTYGNSSGSSGAATGSSISTSKFLKIDDFDATHKAAWYSKLYSQSTSSFTPLRSALSTAGRYFSGKNDLTNQGMIPSAADDPLQYSCQQNFTILTTDGYWNGGSGRKIDGTSLVGNQDGVLSELDAYNPADKKFAVSPRPIYDGATAYYIWNTAAINTYQYASCSVAATQQKTVQWQSRTLTSTQERTSTLQQRTQALQERTSTLQQRTSSNSGSTWTAWSNVSSCSPDGSGSSRTQCQYTAWTGWANVASCDAENQDTSGTWSVGTARQCQYGAASAWSNVGTCDAIAQDASDPYNVATAVSCQYSAWSAWGAVGSCAAVAQDTSDPYTVGTSRECQSTYSAWTNTTGICTPSATVQCQSSDITAWTNVVSCTASGPNSSGQETLCQSVASTAGKKIQYKATKTATTYPGPGQSGSIVSTSNTLDSTWTDRDGVCHPNGLEPVLPGSSTVTGMGPPSPPAGCTSGVQEWPCETYSSSGGSSDTLADVAQYYYKTDLRSSALGNCTGAEGLDVCSNNVPKTGTGAEDDKASWQHMTTFTMGLGLDGSLPFSSSYKTDTSGTFTDIRSGNVNWPVPIADSPTALDDLWHAAVDGRGQYFSAKDPDAVVSGLSTALAGVKARVGSAAAAATSNLEPVDGDNFIYIPKYVTVDWTGELESRQIDPKTGAISATIDWSARDNLDAMVITQTNTATDPDTVTTCDKRTIKLFREGATNNLIDFKWNTDSCNSSNLPAGSPQTTLNGSEQAYFTNITLLSQYADMTDGNSGTANQRGAAAGANLVNFLRGHRGREGFVANDINKLYRTREHVLGDVINSKPVGVKGPLGQYVDAGYAAYQSANANRTPMLYVAANDGLLHAFRASDGVEMWAFMPTMVLPNLYKLASVNYANNHSYYVDGAPGASSVYDTATATWKTILVGGMNKGGKGYYALDITDPNTPKALWEFKHSTTCDDSAATADSDCHLGYSYGNPVISKLTDGTWVVFVTSGYNNVNTPTQPGDGQGYLYVLNAMTGKIIYKIGTGAGDVTTPSGLGKIAGWANDSLRNNTAQRVYGVDLLGNIWRFDVNDNFDPSGREASLVTKVVDSGGTGQPITTRPLLAENAASEPLVYVATGQYLGTSDLSTTQTQTIWAIRDPLTSTVTGLRSTLSQLTLTNVGSGTSASRTLACTARCTAADALNGWYIDLPDTGERVNVDMHLILGTVIVASNVPTNNACDIGGYAWLMSFRYLTGGSVGETAGTVISGEDGTSSLVVGISPGGGSGGGGKFTKCTLSSGEVADCPIDYVTKDPSNKTVSWREVPQ